MKIKTKVIALAATALLMTGLSPVTSHAELPAGDYIVMFDNQANENAEAAKARSQGANIKYTYSAAFKGMAGTFNAAQINALQRNPRVKLIEADGVVTADTTQSSATWGLDRIDQRGLPLSTTYDYTATGTDVTAYVIDTGILISHNEFEGRAITGYSAINDGKGAIDCNGHGTHVSGTIGGKTYGVAKNVKLVAVRVLDCGGSGTTSGVIDGVNWAIGNHLKDVPAVANMSLGGSASTALDVAVSNLVADGVVVAVAAGNSKQDACRYSPARVSSAITVGATTSSDARASYSNFGTCLDIFAPGSSIASSWYTSITATNTISGTSMATPHVAGVAALYLSKNGYQSPATVRDALVINGTSGVVSSAGKGSPNILLYTNY